MADPFAKWRERRAAKAVARAPDDAPVQTYEALYLNRGWSMILLLLWTPVVFGGIVLIVLYEREFNGIPYSTGGIVAFMLFLLASLAFVPLVGPTSRRSWTLFTDRIEIRERPYVPLFGPYRRARIPFAGIAMARLGETLASMEIFEIETRDGRRFRLAPTTIGSGKAAQIDHAGFAAFVDTIRATIDRSGVPRPPGEELRTVTSGLTGVVILGVITALLSALGLLGVWIVLSEGEAIGFQLMGFVLPFAVLFGGLCLNRWRKWRARAD